MARVHASASVQGASTRRRRLITIIPALAGVVSILSATDAWAGDYHLSVDDRAPQSDGLGGSVRSADAVHAIEAYFRGEAPPAGERYDNLVASLTFRVVAFASHRERRAMNLALARIAAWPTIENEKVLSEIALAWGASLCPELHVQSLSKNLTRPGKTRLRRLMRTCKQ
jgi:hypothetical protein